MAVHDDERLADTLIDIDTDALPDTDAVLVIVCVDVIVIDCVHD